MISSPVTAGVDQVPPSGQPTVLKPSRPSVGGYPRVAAIASTDLGIMAQLRAGDSVRFQEITLPEAHELRILQERDLNLAREGLARIVG
jgi:antagonist of KipI